MTAKTELAKLFHYDKATPRIVGYVRNTAIAKDEIGTAIAVIGTLLDPESKVATKRQLFVQMQPPDAVNVALAILVIAKQRGWKIPLNDFVELPGGERGKH